MIKLADKLVILIKSESMWVNTNTMSSCNSKLTWSAHLHFKTAWTLFFSHYLFKLFHMQSLADFLHSWHHASSTIYHRRILLFVFSFKFLKIRFSLAASIIYQNKASLFFTEFQRAFMSFHSQDFNIYLMKVPLSIILCLWPQSMEYLDWSNNRSEQNIFKVLFPI